MRDFDCGNRQLAQAERQSLQRRAGGYVRLSFLERRMSRPDAIFVGLETSRQLDFGHFWSGVDPEVRF